MKTKKTQKCGLFVFALLAAGAFSIPQATAANLIWDPSHNTTGSDGAGTWDNATANWATGTNDTAWYPAATAVFGAGGTADTVSIAAGGLTNSGGIYFNSGVSGTYTIAGGGTLLLGGGITASNPATLSAGITLDAGNQMWSAGSGSTLTLSGTVTRKTGSTLLLNTADGSGTLAFNPTLVNGIVGTWAILTNSGTGANNSSSGCTFATTSSGDIVAYTGATAETTGYAWSSPGANTANYDVSGVNQIGVTRTANTIRYTGTGATQYLGNNDTIYLTNNAFLNAGSGTYIIATGDVLGTGQNPTTSHGKVVVGANRDLVVAAASANITFALPIWDDAAGASAVTILGPGTVTFNKATNTYTGGTYVNSGSLVLSGAGTTLGATTCPLIVNGGTLDLGGLSVIVGAVTNTGGTIQNGTLTNSAFIANNPFATTISATLAGTSGTLTKNGNSTLTLTAANTYGGATTVNAGVLNVLSSQLGTGAITVKDNGTLAVTVTGTNQLQPATLTLGSASGGTNLFIGVNSTNVAPIKAGTLTLTGASRVSFQALTLATGTYPLIIATTTNGSGTLAVGTLPNGVTAHLTTTGSGPYTYNLVVDSIAADVWAAGNGNWDTTSQNWKFTGSTTHYTEGMPVMFDDTASGSGPFTVTITPATVSPAAVLANITNKNYTLTGAAAGVGIAGGGSLVKNAGGQLTLVGTNTYSGGTTINGGTLQLGDGTSQNGVVAGGIVDNAALVVANPNDQTLAGAISGTGGLTKTGNGTLTLTAANSYAGATTVNAGALELTNAATFGNGAGMVTNQAAILLGGGVIANPILNNGTLTNLGTTVMAGTISGAGIIETTNSGNLILTGSNNFTGTVYVEPSSSSVGLVLANSHALGSSGSVVVNTVTSGTPGGSRVAVTNGLTMPAGVSLQLSCSYSALTRSELYSAGTSGQTNTWSGPITLTGDNYVAFDGASGTYWNIAGTVSGPNFISATPGSTGLQLRQVNGLITGAINLPSGNVLLTDGVTWTLQPPAPDVNSWLYTLIAFGTLKAGTNDALPATTILNSAGGSGTLDLNGFTQVLGGFINTTTGGAGANPITNSSATSAATLIFSNSATASTYGGTLLDSYPTGAKLSLTVAAGTLGLSSSGNTYSGNTTIATGGTLQLAGTGVIPCGANKGVVVVNSGGVLDMNNNSVTVNALSGVGTVDIVSAGGSSTLTLGTNNANGTFDGTIQNSTGTISVSKTGSGTIVLTGANTYGGSTAVGQGKLVISSAQTGTGDNATVADGSALGVTLTGSSQWTPVSLTLGSGTGATMEFNAVNTATPPAAPGTLTVNGTAKVSVNSINGSVAVNNVYPLFASTPSGATLGASGTFYLNATPAGVGGHLAIASDGAALTFVVDSVSEVWRGNISGNWDTTTANWSTGLFANGNSVLFDDTATGATHVTVNAAVSPGVVTVANSNLTYVIAASSGKAIGGTHALIKSGSGKLTLSGPNTFSGGTVLMGGQLNLGSGATGSANSPIGTGALTISGGTLENASGSDMTLQPTIPENWSGSFAYAGATNSLSLGAGAVTLSGNSEVTVAARTLTVPGVIADGGNGYSLTKTGNGALTLGSANTYAGTTTLAAGQLNLNHNQAISTGTFIIAGGTIDNTGSGDVTLADNPQNWNGDFTYAGTLHNLNLGAGTVTLGANRNVTVSANTLTVGPITGDYGLTKLGAGTLVLSNDNTFTGNLFARGGTTILNGTLNSTNYCSIALNTNDVATLILAGTGSFTGGNDFNVGDLANAAGTLVVQDSASLTVGQLFIGSANAAGSTASGVVNQTGGSVTETNAGIGMFAIGGRTSTNGTGVYNLSGGTLTAAAGIRVGSTGTGTMTISGSAVVNANGGFNIARIAGSTGTLNLNGGTVTALNITSSTGVNATNNFNGATVKPTSANTWISGLTQCNVRNGGAILDTAGFNVTVSQGLQHSVLAGDNAVDGGLTKNGNGTLLLSGTNTYTGNTTVNGGTLEISLADMATNSTVIITNGAVLQLDFATTNIVSGVVLNGVSQSPGVYNSSTASGYITGSGSLLIPSPGPIGPGPLTNTISGTTLSLSWPAGLGWKLQQQTNSLTAGLGTNWVYVTDGSVSSTNITIDASKPTMSFYRLAYP